MSTVTESVSLPTREDVSKKIASTRLKLGLSWVEVAALIERAPVWTAAALTGQCALSESEAEIVGKKFGLDDYEVKLLQVCPYRGALEQTIPSDPFVYRFYEIMQVYGPSMREVAQEEFGDGIMSAIDFSIDVDREPNPNGDRVRITFSGKFLPYKKF